MHFIKILRSSISIGSTQKDRKTGISNGIPNGTHFFFFFSVSWKYSVYSMYSAFSPVQSFKTILKKSKPYTPLAICMVNKVESA